VNLEDEHAGLHRRVAAHHLLGFYRCPVKDIQPHKRGFIGYGTDDGQDLVEPEGVVASAVLPMIASRSGVSHPGPWLIKTRV
jgi:hypothetical protein